MQLRYYFSLLLRYWAIILVLPILASGISLYNQLQQPNRYAASAHLMITQTPHPQDMIVPFPDFNLVSSWQSSEYIVDDMPQVVDSITLATDVQAWLKPKGYDVSPSAIQAALRAQTFHRSVALFVETDSPDLARAMLEGAIASLQANGLAYWDRDVPTNGNGGLSIAILNPPTDGAPMHSNRQMLTNVALRGGLALGVAIGIALLLHYLDDKLYTSRQIEVVTKLAVLAAIPEEKP